MSASLLLVLVLAPAVAAPLESIADDDDAPGLERRPKSAAPLETPSSNEQSTDPPDSGVAPFHGRARPLEPHERSVPVGAPLGLAVPPTPARLDPRAIRIVRLDLGFGPLWRIRRVDTMVSTSAELGPMHGVSAALFTALIVDTQREVVQAFDVPIGAGAILRGRLARRPLYASVGLTAGLLVHRAKTERGVVHRVDPDFRLPIRFAWTIATVGLSVLLEQGFSVRTRHYERRGVEVWGRHPYRIGFAIALHSDVMAGRAMQRRLLQRKGR